MNKFLPPIDHLTHRTIEIDDHHLRSALGFALGVYAQAREGYHTDIEGTRVELSDSQIQRMASGKDAIRLAIALEIVSKIELGETTPEKKSVLQNILANKLLGKIVQDLKDNSVGKSYEKYTDQIIIKQRDRIEELPPAQEIARSPQPELRAPNIGGATLQSQTQPRDGVGFALQFFNSKGEQYQTEVTIRIKEGKETEPTQKIITLSPDDLKKMFEHPKLRRSIALKAITASCSEVKSHHQKNELVRQLLKNMEYDYVDLAFPNEDKKLSPTS